MNIGLELAQRCCTATAALELLDALKKFHNHLVSMSRSQSRNSLATTIREEKILPTLIMNVSKLNKDKEYQKLKAWLILIIKQIFDTYLYFPPDQTLNFFQQLPPSTIAVLLKSPCGHVRSMLSRAFPKENFGFKWRALLASFCRMTYVPANVVAGKYYMHPRTHARMQEHTHTPIHVRKHTHAHARCTLTYTRTCTQACIPHACFAPNPQASHTCDHILVIFISHKHATHTSTYAHAQYTPTRACIQACTMLAHIPYTCACMYACMRGIFYFLLFLSHILCVFNTSFIELTINRVSTCVSLIIQYLIYYFIYICICVSV